MAAYDINGNVVSVDIDESMTTTGKAPDAKIVGTLFEELDVSIVEPKSTDIPRVYVDGVLPATKDDGKKVMRIKYVSNSTTFDAYCTLKVQGNYSATDACPKKNYNVQLYKDEACTDKKKINFKGWGKSYKYCWKANWVDITQARNIVSARLWGEICATRHGIEEYPEGLLNSPNYGSVDGFFMILYVNGKYWGRYTWNLKKDTQMFGMDDTLETNAALIGEDGNACNFRSIPTVTAGVDWEDNVHDTPPESIVSSFQSFVSFVINSTDEEFVNHLEDYCYVSSLIDYWIFVVFIAMQGGFLKSQRFDTYDGTKWIAGVYDMDAAWCMHWDGKTLYDHFNYPYDFYNYNEGGHIYTFDTNLLHDRLFSLFKQQIKARYYELRNNVLTLSNVTSLFETFLQMQTAELIAEDYASTTDDGAFTNIPSKTTNTKQRLRQIIRERFTYCDNFMANLT